jgi:choline dehydrogenase-like flavoprotein
VSAASTDPDFVIVGAGAAGGVVAKELATGGFRVVVLEQGPWLREPDFKHDEIWANRRHALTNDHSRQPNTRRLTETETATLQPTVSYGRGVGGGSVHFTANYWRFRELDFVERSRRGRLAGTGLDDWPITYAELEPYYTKAEWELGVSGLAGAHPSDSPRSRPYPLPPLPRKPVGALAEHAARKLGWTATPSPMAILSQPYAGRAPCVQCGFCEASAARCRRRAARS